MEVPTSQPIIKYFTHCAFCIFFYCCAKTLIAEKMCENWQVNITWQRSNVISLYHMARLYCITWQLYLMSILYLFTKLYSISWLHSMLWLTCRIICALCAGVLYMFYALALVCDHYFVPSLDVIIGRLTGSWYTCTSLFGRTDYNHYNQRISRDRAACGHCTVQWLEYPWLTFVKGISHIPPASNPAVQSFCLM